MLDCVDCGAEFSKGSVAIALGNDVICNECAVEAFVIECFGCGGSGCKSCDTTGYQERFMPAEKPLTLTEVTFA